MIGLKRGKVTLLLYNRKWKRSFEQEKARILKEIGNDIVEIQHVGSTSVPGLAAKPIIDMAAGVRRFKDAGKLVKSLRLLEYKFDRSFQHQRFFAKGPDSKRTHYLHVMRYKGSKWRHDALFRDYLITHPSRLKEYAKLKIRLSKQYPDERQKYSDGKKKFIESTIKLAEGVASKL